MSGTLTKAVVVFVVCSAVVTPVEVVAGEVDILDVTAVTVVADVALGVPGTVVHVGDREGGDVYDTLGPGLETELAVFPVDVGVLVIVGVVFVLVTVVLDDGDVVEYVGVAVVTALLELVNLVAVWLNVVENVVGWTEDEGVAESVDPPGVMLLAVDVADVDFGDDVVGDNVLVD